MTTASWNFSFFDSLGAARPGAIPNSAPVRTQQAVRAPDASVTGASTSHESERSEIMAFWARGQSGPATPAWLRKDASAVRAGASTQPSQSVPAHPIKPRPVTPFFSAAPSANAVRVLRVSQAAGRLRICGRMADVCAELERLSARSN